MFIVLPTPYLGNIGTARVEALITLALHRKIERIATMATSIATVTNTATRIPSGFRFPLPAAPYREIKLVAKTTGALPISAGAFNLQYLIDNFKTGLTARGASS